MRSAVSHIVVLAVALHTVLGCCWHHAHDALPTETAAAHVESCHDCCCRHTHREYDAVESHDEHDDSSSHSSEEHSPTRCGDKCQFVTSGRVQSNDISFAAMLDLTPAIGAAVIEPDWCVARGGVDDPTTDPPPLRLHLLHQLLLI